jgi:hypothetical protein
LSQQRPFSSPTASWVLRVIALILFIIAAIVYWPEGNFEHAAALVPLGLACWVGSTLLA